MNSIFLAFVVGAYTGNDMSPGAAHFFFWAALVVGILRGCSREGKQ